MSTPRDCSGGPIGLGTRRIAQRGLSRQTEGSHFLFSNDLILQDRAVASLHLRCQFAWMCYGLISGWSLQTQPFRYLYKVWEISKLPMAAIGQLQ